MSEITSPDAPGTPPAEAPAAATEGSVPAAQPGEAPTPVPAPEPEPLAAPASEAPAAEEAPEEEPATPETELPEETPVQRHFAAPEQILLERVDVDDTFRVRPEEELEDVSALAMDIARLGQLFPIDVRQKGPDRYQVITGFRRVAALRFLQREKVLARLHVELSDEDATLMALAAAIHGLQVDAEALATARAWLEEAGRLSPTVRDMLEKALAKGDELAPESVEEEVDADELAADVTVRLGEINQDLSLLADVFSELDDERKQTLLTQLRYSAELVAFLESKS